MPDVKWYTLMVLSCSVVFFSVEPGFVSSDAGCVWRPARTGFRQQVGALRGYRLQGVVSHVEEVTVGRWARGSAIRRPREHADLAHRLCSAALQHAPEAPYPRNDASASSSMPWTVVTWSSGQLHQHAAHDGRSRSKRA